MAKTIKGIEFFLLSVIPGDESHPSLKDLESRIRSLIRDGDALVVHEKKLYIAVVTNVQGASRAAKRILQKCRDNKIDASVRLLPEPYPGEIVQVTGTIIQHDVPIEQRRDSPNVTWR